MNPEVKEQLITGREEKIHGGKIVSTAVCPDSGVERRTDIRQEKVCGNVP